MVMDVKNKAHRCDKPRPSLYATTGNEIYRHGQRNLSARATEFITTGNEIYTNARWFSPQVWPIYFIIIHAFIYIRIGINNKIHI